MAELGPGFVVQKTAGVGSLEPASDLDPIDSYPVLPGVAAVPANLNRIVETGFGAAVPGALQRRRTFVEDSVQRVEQQSRNFREEERTETAYPRS